jgi:hypothetical protein
MLKMAKMGVASVYPLDAMRKLPPQERRELSRAIQRAQVDATTRAESDAALEETERGLREDA